MSGGGATGFGERASSAIALLAFATFAALVLFVSAGPFITADGWFHLGAGAAYVHEGPWPKGDPMLFTARPDAPIQHEWLFGALAYLVREGSGFHGLRALHALLVAGTIALAFSIFRRAGGSRAAGAFGACAFLLLAWFRFWQFRPDLVSIPATLVTYRLLLEERESAPSWKRVALFALLVAAWANVHSLFALALLLVAAGIAGFAVQAAFARGEGRTNALRSAKRLAAAFGLGTLASIANPRGIDQLLTFVHSTQGSRLWSIRDEWQAFVPWEPSRYGYELGMPVIVAASALLALFALAALAALPRLARRTDERREPDWVLLALATAASIAMVASIRFLWMGAFPLLFLASALRPIASKRAAAAAAGCAALSVLCCAAFAASASFDAIEPPRAGYLSNGYSLDAYPMAAGVRFLQDAGLEGRLYCDYTTGGFVGYWLAPKLRTFIDGRVEHYPPDVFDDYLTIRNQRAEPGGTSFLEVLDRRGIDAFEGHGLPIGTDAEGGMPIPLACLDGVPGWITAFRSYDGGVYVRARESNGANLERLERYCAEERLPFDRARGLDMDRLVRERADWAIEHRVLPMDHAELLAALEQADAAARYRALARLGLAYALVGAHEEGLAMDRRALAIAPDERWPRRRASVELLALGRMDEAGRELARLEAQDAGDPWLALYRRALGEVRLALPGADASTPLGRRLVLDRLPLFDTNEYLEAVRQRYREVRPRERD